MESFTLPPLETEFVLEQIQQLVSPCSVYVFGYRHQTKRECNYLLDAFDVGLVRHHYYLVVFSQQLLPNGGSDIAQSIAAGSGHAITATVLVHKVKDLGTKQVGQQWFFNQVLRDGQRLCLDTTAPPYLLHVARTRDTKATTAFWHKCVRVAQFNMHAVTVSDQLDVELCKIALLHSALHQLALGLIRVFLGYTPTTFSLVYLLDLCGSFTALPSQVFKTETSLAQKRYKMLCASPSMLNHWIDLHANEQHFIWLLDSCQSFLKEAETLAMIELNRLEL
ncbi:hypothetical protein FLGE108171_11760 [Flavobacterium gelidilacus]|uniref:hypothetical protein n=1 Tax=Flavobacterium gelidilacus TaxID=206041 RepID=UPI00041D15A5|nr:hypothetical protein [Flavobacterium gelidilacus]